MSENPTLLLQGIVKEFPGVRALDDVDLTIHAGQVHAIMGENGAGKSTLIQIIAGVLRPDRGTITLDGQLIDSTVTPVEMRQMGIATVFQEAELFPNLSIAENLAHGTGLPSTYGWVHWREVYDGCQQAMDVLDRRLDGRQLASSLSVAETHLLQIASAVRHQSRVVILDEPTSSLSREDVRWLFEQIRRLKSQGAAIIYISHRQEEIFELADRVTVLRDGGRIWTKPIEETNSANLVEAMVGRPIEWQQKQHVETGPVKLSVQNLRDGAGAVQGAELEVHAGEVVGVYGLIGSGRTEMLECLFGLRTIATGSVRVDGRICNIRSTADALSAGIALVPEDRLRAGIFAIRPVRDNIAVASLKELSRGPWLSSSRLRQAAQDQATKLGVVCRNIFQSVATLSGGNQQKTVLGRWLMKQPQVLLLDEPTRGVDVGAKDEIHQLLRDLAKNGQAVLMVSSDLPEVMQYSDRILVFREGRVAGNFVADQVTASEIAELALTKSSKDPAEQNTKPDRSPLWKRIPGYEAFLAGLVVLIVLLLGLSSDGLRISSILGGATVWIILAMAAGVVIISGAIDISIGSLLALCCVLSSWVLQTDLPIALRIPLAVLVSIGVGCAGGCLNATLTILGRVHPIVVTLGMMSVYRGLVIWLMGGKSIVGLPATFGLLVLFPESGFRPSIFVGIAAVVLMIVWLNQTSLGRTLFACGDNPKAATLCGISQSRTWFLAFAVGGGLVGLAATLQLAQQLEMQSRLATGWELQAIAMAVVGGIAIQGGRGTMWGVALGAILLRLVNSLLVRWELAGEQLNLIVGILILLAVGTDHIRMAIHGWWRSKQHGGPA